MSSPATPHERFLWGLCYRITGVAADADEIVQETMLRALEHRGGDRSLEAWTTRVASNLACDRLRLRQRESYIGAWLPSPADFVDELPTSARYEQLESLSLAFLTTLEVLPPRQRAVLVLREVFGWSARDVGDALGLTEENVRTLHRRARARLAPWTTDRAAQIHTPREVEVTLVQLVDALSQGNHERVLELLSDDVVELVDGNGRYHSAKKPIHGARRVALFNARLLQIRGAPSAFGLRVLNGAPALWLEFEVRHPFQAPRNLIAISLDRGGRISRLFSIVADEKLTHAFS